MSEHAQALMISTKVCNDSRMRMHPNVPMIEWLCQVHAVFGWTLMLAGITRIIEASFIVPKFLPDPSVVDGDSHSDHTLADSGAIKDDSITWVPAWGRPFRHLPPFVGFYSLTISNSIHSIYCQ